jgi:hypothetical protein
MGSSADEARPKKDRLLNRIYTNVQPLTMAAVKRRAACDVRNLLIGEVSRWGCRCCSPQDRPDFADFASQWLFFSDFSTNSATWRGLFA